MSYHALTFLLLVVVLSIGRVYVRNSRSDRSAFVADLETELVGIGHSLSADQYNVTLLSVLDKHAPAAKAAATRYVVIELISQ